MDMPSNDTALTSAQADTAAPVVQTTATAPATPDATGAQPAVDAKPNGDAPATTTPPAAETKPDVPAGAPEKYEFKAPEGYEIDAELLNEFSPVLKGLDLSQDDAQKVVDLAPKLIEHTQNKTIAAVFEHIGFADHANWATALKADPELGGEKLAENTAVAVKAMQAFASPALQALLEKSGLGNHPEMVRAFYKVGKQISEDGFVPGGKTTTAQPFYANSNMNR